MERQIFCLPTLNSQKTHDEPRGHMAGPRAEDWCIVQTKDRSSAPRFDHLISE